MDQNEANYKNWFLSEHDPEDNLMNLQCKHDYELGFSAWNAALKIAEVQKPAHNKQSTPLLYPCSVCYSKKDCAFVGSNPCPLR